MRSARIPDRQMRNLVRNNPRKEEFSSDSHDLTGNFMTDSCMSGVPGTQEMCWLKKKSGSYDVMVNGRERSRDLLK